MSIWSQTLLKFQRQKFLLSVLALVAAVSLSAFTATNPEYNFPGLVEGAICSTALLILGFARREVRSRATRVEQHLMIVTSLLICVLTGRYLIEFQHAGRPGAYRCLELPAYIPKIECLLQLPFSENYGLRQILFHCTAALIFGTAALLARTHELNRNAALACLISPLLFMASYQIAVFYAPIHESLVGSNFVSGGYHFKLQRGVAITGNPGWFWPLMAPGLAVAIALSASDTKGYRWLGALATALFSIAIFSAQQRGGYILLIMYFVMYLAVLAPSLVSLKKSRRRSSIIVMIAVTLVAMAAVDGAKLAQFLSTTFGMPLRVDSISFDANRIGLWRVALGGISANLWFGHGYQSWLPAFRPLAQNAGLGHLAFDTAHNLWVQMLFELGVVHTLAVSALIAAVGVTMLRRAMKAELILKVATLLGLLGLLEISMIQEVDYINTIYYHLALVSGFIFGSLPQVTSTSVQAADCKSPWASAARRSLFMAGTLIGIATIGAFFQYSWGGYSFEWMATSNGGYFERWYRPRGAISAFKTRLQKVYSVFPVVFPVEKDPEVDLAVTDKRWAAFLGDGVVIENGSKMWGRQVLYQALQQTRLGQSEVFMRVQESTLQTNMGIFWSKGLFRWERAPEDSAVGEKWCGQECSFILKKTSCSIGTLVVYGSHPDITPDRPVSLKMTAVAIGQTLLGSSRWPMNADLKALKQAPGGLFVVNQPQERLSLQLPNLAKQDYGWLVNLSVDRYFDEATLGIANPRRLGIRLADFKCL